MINLKPKKLSPKVISDLHRHVWWLINLRDGINHEAQQTQPMLTTVRLPRDEMGRLAMTILLDRLGGGHKSVVRLELEGKLLVRESC